MDVATKGSEAGESAALGAVPRKLTRSFSARASRLATAARPVHTDTDSDVDDKNDKQ